MSNHDLTRAALPALFSFLLLLSCDSKIPVISSIDPKIGRMGDVITITGQNFGASREESHVTIAGISPTNSSYYLWEDNLIMVRIPEFGESGLLYVNTKGGKSNGVLFSNSASVPRPVDGEELGLAPKIISVNPQTGAPGTIITITGSNFGISQEGSLLSALNDGGVFFSWDYKSASLNPYIVREPEYIEVSETEFGYVSWNTREIQVRVPDGAVNGNIEVRTPHGKSRPFSFNTGGKPGVKNFTDKRSYTVSYSVDIRVLEATRPNTLYLWIPMPVRSPSQRNVTLISRNTEPFLENYKGVSLYKLENLTTGSRHLVNLSFNVDIYSVETEINPMSVKQEKTPLYAAYTHGSDIIPAAIPQVKTTVNTVTGREQNPYIKARLLYNWIIENIQITQTPIPNSGNIAAAIEQKRADPYTAALLFTTLARAAGIPCIPAAGVLIDRYGQTMRHYWTEFWIDYFGWIPVDPAMGAGAVGAQANREDAADFYFGNIDNQHITFSRGEVVLSQMESRGRSVSHTQSYSLQNLWEEASGGLDSYTSLWGDVTISGIYVQ
jgi:transglutaminase-like putative cysteine protease